jgi:Domain of unknown function (DUF4126)
MDVLAVLGRTLSFSLAAGVNLYATVALIGLAERYHWVSLPPEYAPLGHAWVIGLAALLYGVEFVADKVPWVDTLWDTVHTFIRPVGGAALAVVALGDASPALRVGAALLGGTVAAGSHFAKAGTRVVVNSSPEPFSNWALSVIEDGFVASLGLLALKFPVVALGASTLILLSMAALAIVLGRAFRRRFLAPSG